MKKFLSMMLSIVMVFSLSATAFAAEDTTARSTTITIGDYVSDEDMAFFEKVERIFAEFQLDNENKLSLSITDEVLMSDYSFTASDVARLNEMFSYQHNAVENEGNPPMTRLHVSDWKIYFDLGDVHAFLFAAAQVGPAAITAALSALGSVYPGVGTVWVCATT